MFTWFRAKTISKAYTKFVKINDYTDGLVHISEISPFRVENIPAIIKEGMIVPVKVIKVDAERGKISLSIKEADKDFFKPKSV